MGQQIIDLVIVFRWQDWLTIVGFLFGIVTLLAFIEQRRSARGTVKLVKWAELNLDKTISEEEIKQLLAQKSAMEDQIAKNIPALARVAVLKEQAELHRGAIAVHYSAWQKLTSEIESATPVPGLDPQIQNVILDRIVPRFEREQEAIKLRTRLTVLSVSTAAIATMFPFGLGSVFAMILSPVLISTALKLYALNEERNAAYNSIRLWTHIAYFVCAIFIIGFGALLLYSAENNSTAGLIGRIACGVGIVLMIAYYFVRSTIDKWLAAMLGATKS